MSLEQKPKLKKTRGDGRPKRRNENSPPLRTALAYLVFGVLWILLSDKLVQGQLPEINQIPAQTIKGLFYVALSALLIYFVSRSSFKKLQTSESQLDFVLQAIPDAVLMVDPNGQILLCNTQVERLFGHNPEELIGQSMAMLIPERFRKAHEQYQQSFINAPHQRYAPEKVFYGLHKDGREFPAEIVLNYQFVDDKLMAVASVRDITERKLAEEKLQESEARFRSISEITSDWARLWRLTPEGDLVQEWNAGAFSRITGYTLEELQAFGKQFSVNIHPDDKELMETCWAEAIELGTLTKEYRFITKNGDVRWIRDKFHVEYTLGRPTQIYVAGQDITDRKLAELALQENTANQQALIDSTDDLIWSVDTQYRLIIGNAVFLRYNEEILGRKLVPGENILYQVIPSESRNEWRGYFDRALEGELFTVEGQMQFARSQHDMEFWFNPIHGRDGLVIGAAISGRDITERKQAQAALQDRESRYRTLFEDSPVAIWEEDFSGIKDHLDILRQQGVTDLEEYLETHPEMLDVFAQSIKILNVNNAAIRMYEAENEEELIENTSREMSPGERENLHKDILAIAAGRTNHQWEGRDETMTGRAIDINLSWSLIPGYEQDYSKVIVTTIDITRQQQAIRDLQNNQQILHEAQAMAKLGSWTADLRTKTFDISPENSALLGIESGIHPLQELLTLLYVPDSERALEALEHSTRTGLPIDVQFRIQVNGKLKWLHTKARVSPGKDGKPAFILGVTQDITERMLANEQIQASEARFRQLAENLEEAFWVTDPVSNMEVYISPAGKRIWGRPVEELLYIPNAFIETVLPEDRSLVITALEQQRQGKHTDIEYRVQRSDGSIRWIWDRAFPIYAENEGRLLVAGLAADITDRKNAEARIQQQLQRLNALSAIDNIISASLDMQLTLNVFITETLLQLKVDAADVLLLNPHMHTLEFAVGQGFRTTIIQNSKLQLGENLIGQAIPGRQVIHISNLFAAGDRFNRTQLIQAENFYSYYGLPLIAKGQLKGILEIFHRLPLDPDPEWLEYLKTLAAQAAIAIDNAQLFENLQRSNSELIMAYDATIAGWSHAMDLRDKETEGHTQRVTQLTLRLAERMGISQEEMVHIRRGALLHDIGKLGVPDQILLKPGKLTDEEWALMRQHPTYAFEMLHTIHYLKPALDIPYCHHEKWDGTGYPQGLKGKEIPFAARIFSIVDVWDALSSDRPYRPGWPVEKIRGYIQEQSGRHFDPTVADAFLNMLDDISPHMFFDAGK
ncbi:MAG TPA: PAS domain S-box protein [Anaerolineales bacterium]|nr:PAS domain S-box protein [Anaerolineales bacterium]